MRRLVTLAMLLLAFMVLVAPVSANNGRGNGNGNGDNNGPPGHGVMNKKACEEAGGVWHNDRGVKYCAKLEHTEERPGVGEEPPQEIRDFWAAVDTAEEFGPDVDEISFYTREEQRGTIGAPGTRGTTYHIIHNVCAALGPPDLVHPAVCSLLYQLLFPDD